MRRLFAPCRLPAKTFTKTLAQTQAKTLAVAIAFTGLATPALAEGLAIKPGQWQRDTSVTTTLSVAGDVTTLPVETSVAGECLSPAEAIIDPSDLTEEGCALSDVVKDGQVLSFDLACDRAGVIMEGTMKLTSSEEGARLDGAIALSGSHEQGVAMTSNVIIRSRWIGDCSAGD